jgi:hypothetical protein
MRGVGVIRAQVPLPLGESGLVRGELRPVT